MTTPDHIVKEIRQLVEMAGVTKLISTTHQKGLGADWQCVEIQVDTDKFNPQDAYTLEHVAIVGGNDDKTVLSVMFDRS